MPSYVTPKKNAAFVFTIGLVDQANTKVLKASPTLAAGDFKVSVDNAAFANLTNLPTVTPSGSTAVQISLTSGEMNGDNIIVTCIDAAGAEWCDQMVVIQTTAQQIDDLTTPAQVNTEVVDALSVDTYAEPTGVPGATVSLAAKIGRVYQALRNGLSVTSTAKTFTDDAGASLWKKTLADNGATYTESEGGAP